MNSPTPTRQRAIAAALFLILALPTGAQAQFGRGAAPPPVQGRDGAPFDLTGYWTALITDDWQYRMITPVAGDYSYIPLNDEGRRVADEWDSAADEAAGEECKAYAAPAIMRLPTRLRIAWENDQTLRIDTDLGMQTRMFHFDGAEAPMPANRPGRDSLEAAWEIEGGRGGPVFGSLKVDTEQSATGLPAKEWRAIQRRHLHDRVLQPADGRQRRPIPGDSDLRR